MWPPVNRGRNSDCVKVTRMWCYAPGCGTRTFTLRFACVEGSSVGPRQKSRPIPTGTTLPTGPTQASCGLSLSSRGCPMPDTVDAFLLHHITTRLVAEFPPQVERCLEVLSEDDLWWRPHELSNAVGNLVLHVAGSNRHFLEHVIGGAPGVRDRDAEFAARGGPTKADVLKVWRDVTARVDAVLRALTPERLVQSTSDRNKS